MARELQNPPELHPAPGFSHIAVAEGTRVVHVAGQLGLNADFSLAAEDLHGQTVKAMQNVEVAMRAAGVAWDDVVRLDGASIAPTVTWGINPGQSVPVTIGTGFTVMDANNIDDPEIRKFVYSD